MKLCWFRHRWYMVWDDLRQCRRCRRVQYIIYVGTARGLIRTWKWKDL